MAEGNSRERWGFWGWERHYERMRERAGEKLWNKDKSREKKIMSRPHTQNGWGDWMSPMGELKEKENDRGTLDLRDKCQSTGGVFYISHLTQPPPQTRLKWETQTLALWPRTVHWRLIAACDYELWPTPVFAWQLVSSVVAVGHPDMPLCWTWQHMEVSAHIYIHVCTHTCNFTLRGRQKHSAD